MNNYRDQPNLRCCYNCNNFYLSMHDQEYGCEKHPSSTCGYFTGICDDYRNTRQDIYEKEKLND